ncbi:V-type proton ATPase subunit C 1-B [Rhinichthys klamathensis goyatoka]|uniref:V-type proton ATPase subunit C 1-B n=1 Tax=Rhinichthys klamathensis goyatoka TaxID=3034132 RepID=UPI0024B5F306|nr:V-type proton ATPase subunit C 1-B [Rhinichthys klamathensis goyatoka]
MMEFWLISVPLDKISCQSLEKLKRVAAKSGLATSSRFNVPELKVGTLDVLLGVSDDLSRLDTYTEGVMRQTSQCLGEVMEEFSGKLLESVLANGEHKTNQKDRRSPLKSYCQTVQVFPDVSMDLATYVTRFQWDRAKYPTAQPLKTLTEIITKQVLQVDTELKSRRAAYSHLKASSQSFERKNEGSLQTRALTNIVKKEDLVLNSEYLTTLLVVVPRTAYTLWEKTYESMSKFVVPRSSRKLVEDADAGIFTVTLFKSVISEFKAHAKIHRFTVREYNSDEAEKQKQEISRLAVDKKELYRTFVCWLKVNFSEIFVAWIHVKVLRIFVESVLRYGLPVSFQAVLLQPSKKNMKQLRQQLNSIFKHLDPASVTGKPDVGLEIPEGSTGQQEYYTLICYPIKMNLVDPS